MCRRSRSKSPSAKKSSKHRKSSLHVSSSDVKLYSSSKKRPPSSTDSKRHRQRLKKHQETKKKACSASSLSRFVAFGVWLVKPNLTILCSQAWRATAGLDIYPLPADVRDSCFRGGVGARVGKPPVVWMPSDSSEQSQRGSCEPLTAVAKWEDIILR